MAKFHKKPVVIEAVQWFKNGDHPLDGDPKTEGDCPVFPPSGLKERSRAMPPL